MLGPRQGAVINLVAASLLGDDRSEAVCRQGGRPRFNEGSPPEDTGASEDDLGAYRERLRTWRGDYRDFLREQARLRQEGQARLREVHGRRARETAQALAELQVGRPTLLVRSCM